MQIDFLKVDVDGCDAWFFESLQKPGTWESREWNEWNEWSSWLRGWNFPNFPKGQPI